MTIDIQKLESVAADCVKIGWHSDAQTVQDALSEITSLRKRVEGDQWQDISTVRETIERCLLWCSEAGLRGKGDTVMGAVYVYEDGTISARGNGMHGDWTFTHWCPLPRAPRPSSSEGEK